MDRKEIVKILSEHFGVKAEYMGTPSFAFQIKSEGETYTIDKAGKITNSEGIELELETLLNPAAVVQEQEEKTVIEEVTATEPKSLKFEITVPMEGHTGTSLRNLVNMIYSKQELIQKSLGFEESIVGDDFVAYINEGKIETLEDFKIAIGSFHKEICTGIEFDFNNKSIAFKFIEEADSEKLKTYTQFIELLNQSAKELRHASYKVKNTDNPKFTFRVFLIRLGMIGNEYKAARKILLAKLEGNTAFRYGKPEKKAEEIAGEQ